MARHGKLNLVLGKEGRAGAGGGAREVPDICLPMVAPGKAFSVA